MVILSFPKSADSINPNIYNLNKFLEDDADVCIEEFSVFKPFQKRYDIFHLHWPDVFFVKSLLGTLLRCFYFTGILGVFKFRDTKLIWTIHNLEPHVNYHPRIYQYMVSMWASNIDGYIVMSKESQKSAHERYSALKNKKFQLIYHGLYDNYQNVVTREDARFKFGIDNDKKILLYIGTIKEYKNIPMLIEDFINFGSSKYVLIIAGRVVNDKLEKKIRSYSNNNIIMDLKFIGDDEMQFYFNAADLVILPFKNILNSGSAMLALSFLRPLYCPNIGSLKDLSSLVGSNVVNTYDVFSLRDIDAVFEDLKCPDKKLLGQFDNKFLSKQLKDFYCYICD